MLIRALMVFSLHGSYVMEGQQLEVADEVASVLIKRHKAAAVEATDHLQPSPPDQSQPRKPSRPRRG